MPGKGWNFKLHAGAAWQCFSLSVSVTWCDFLFYALQGLGDGLREKEKGSLLRSRSPSHYGLCGWPSILGSLPLSAELCRITPAPFRAKSDSSSMALLFSRNHTGKSMSSETEKQHHVTFLFNIIFSYVCVLDCDSQRIINFKSFLGSVAT